MSEEGMSRGDEASKRATGNVRDAVPELRRRYIPSPLIPSVYKRISRTRVFIWVQKYSPPFFIHYHPHIHIMTMRDTTIPN